MPDLHPVPNAPAEIADFAFHAAANIFPMLPDDKLAALADDIVERGQLVPIAIFEGKILDGRNRYLACRMRGVTPHTIEVDTDNPLAYVLSANLHRRQLNTSQRAMLAANLPTYRHGGDRTKAPIGALTDKEAAQMFNVSERAVERARRVLRDAVPEVVAAVEQGEASVSAAAAFAEQTKEEQDEQIADAGGASKAVKDKADPAAKKRPAKQSKDAIKAAADRADRRAKEVDKLWQETHKARTTYVAAATASCSTDAEWEGEIETVADALREAQREQHGGEPQEQMMTR
jgi:ParB-like chromosome segregation protein Spo0J